MANLVAMCLGTIEFSVRAGSFNARSRETSAVIDKPETIEGMSTPTARGVGSDTLTFDGVSYPGFSGTLSTVERLREALRAGKPLLLTDGRGGVHGSWLIERVSERNKAFTGEGIERNAEWTLALTAVPDEELL